MRLEGKVALITGGARGIGSAAAQLFAGEGARVAIADVLDERGRQEAETIVGTGLEAVYIRLDVTIEEEWGRAVDIVVSRFGRLDVLINNAGVYQEGTVEQTTVEGWDSLMSVNAKGVFLGTKAAIPAMQKAGGGSIVNLSSVAGLVGNEIATAYNASKAAVRLLTKATAVQYAGDQIRANSVHPGPIDTDMLAEVFPTPGSMRRRVSQLLLGRLGTPLDIAYGLLFLASDESSYVTGSELVIDGGSTAQ